MVQQRGESPRRALVVGILGQDGFYLTRHLLDLGYSVHGLTRVADTRLDAFSRDFPGVHIQVAAVARVVDAARILKQSEPDELYNLAGVTSVADCEADPVAAFETNSLLPLVLMEAVRQSRRPTRVFQALSSEVFGHPDMAPQDESTPARPVNTYGLAKTVAWQLVEAYRRHHGIYAVGGILYNHESSRRGLNFLTRKVTYHAAAIYTGRIQRLALGSLDDRRDWGFAGDFVRAMRLSLAAPTPADYVIGTGTLHTVRDVLAFAFERLGLDWREFVVSGHEKLRAPDRRELVANPARARRNLGWAPEVPLRSVITDMVDADLRAMQNSELA